MASGLGRRSARTFGLRTSIPKGPTKLRRVLYPEEAVLQPCPSSASVSIGVPYYLYSLFPHSFFPFLKLRSPPPSCTAYHHHRRNVVEQHRLSEHQCPDNRPVWLLEFRALPCPPGCIRELTASWLLGWRPLGLASNRLGCFWRMCRADCLNHDVQCLETRIVSGLLPCFEIWLTSPCSNYRVPGEQRQV
jgi:hypothetical protein